MLPDQGANSTDVWFIDNAYYMLALLKVAKEEQAWKGAQEVM